MEVDLGINKIIGEEMQEHTKILGDRIVEKNTEITTGMKIAVEIKVGIGLEKDHFQEMLIIKGMTEV